MPVGWLCPQVLSVPRLDKAWGYPAASRSAGTGAGAGGNWPLVVLAAAVSSCGVVELLLKGGADANARNGYGLTALVAAVHNDQISCAEKLAMAKVQPGGVRSREGTGH